MARKKGSDPAGADGLELSGEPAEVSEEPAEVIARVAAIDVAKGTGMVCTRVPGESGPGRRVRRVWRVAARYADIAALMAELAGTGIGRLVLESTSDYWRIWYYLAEAAGPGGVAGQRQGRQAPARAAGNRTSSTACGCAS